MSAAAEAVAPLLLQVEGMKCGGCVRAVEQRLLEQPGVRQASVNLMTRTAWVGLDPALEGDPSGPLVAALAGLGFQAQRRDQASTPLSRAQRQRQESWWQQWRRLVVALGLLLVSVLGHLSEAGDLPFPLLADIRLHAVVATLALALPGRPILVRGLVGALGGVPSMDTLVGLGMGSAYLASAVALLVPSLGWQCFFNEPVMLLGFVLLGRFIEERARFRTGRALEQLAALQPDTALLVLGDGPPRPVRVGGLRPEDRVLLLPGDRVPVDGLVLEGRSAVDASSLTGEPLPLQAGPGSELAAGSLNLEAPLTLQVLRSGSDSAVARIIALVEEAQARKAPIQGLADRIAGRFSGLVVLLAGATFLFWWQWGTKLWPQVLQAAPSAQAHGGHQAIGMAAGSLHGAAMAPLPLALQLAISVLVVACPCALGLATPAAITVGSGLAARSGLLFRGGDAIEMAAGLRSVLFDKTGTLTLGRPLVTAVELVGRAAPGGLVSSPLAAAAPAGEALAGGATASGGFAPGGSEADGLVQIPAILSPLPCSRRPSGATYPCWRCQTVARSPARASRDGCRTPWLRGWELAGFATSAGPVGWWSSGSSPRRRSRPPCSGWNGPAPPFWPSVPLPKPLPRGMVPPRLGAWPWWPFRTSPGPMPHPAWRSWTGSAWTWGCLAAIGAWRWSSWPANWPCPWIRWPGSCCPSRSWSGCCSGASGGRWRWWAMALTMRRPWPRPTWALPSARAPRSPRTVLAWWCWGTGWRGWWTPC